MVPFSIKITFKTQIIIGLKVSALKLCPTFHSIIIIGKNSTRPNAVTEIATPTRAKTTCKVSLISLISFLPQMTSEDTHRMENRTSEIKWPQTLIIDALEANPYLKY